MRPVDCASEKNGWADKKGTGLFAGQYEAAFVRFHSDFLGTVQLNGLAYLKRQPWVF